MTLFDSRYSCFSLLHFKQAPIPYLQPIILSTRVYPFHVLSNYVCLKKRMLSWHVSAVAPLHSTVSWLLLQVSLNINYAGQNGGIFCQEKPLVVISNSQQNFRTHKKKYQFYALITFINYQNPKSHIWPKQLSKR